MSKELQVTIETITPNVAENWLTRNFDRNRPYRESHAMQMAADMRSNKWRMSDQAISFNMQHRLVNGRHRLEACLIADMPFMSLVLRNLPDDSVFVLDGGRKRSTDDNLHIAGYDYPRGVGSTVRRMILGVRSSIGRTITDQEVLEFLQAYKKDVLFTHTILSSGRFASTIIRSVVARAAIKKNPQYMLEKFAECLITGMMVHGQEAAILLRNYILEEMQLGGGQRALKLYQMTEAAVMAFINEDRGRKLKPSADELFPIQSLDQFPRGEMPKLAQESA